MFEIVDDALATVASPWLRVVIWALLMSLVSMGLYRLISPQRRIEAVKRASRELQQRIAAFDGEFEQLLPLVLSSLKQSLKHLGLTLPAALAASVPLILCLFQLHAAYGYRTLTPGETVALRVTPESAAVGTDPFGHIVRLTNGEWHLNLPATTGRLVILDSNGTPLLALPDRPTADEVAKPSSLDRIIANPMGSLPPAGAIDRLEFSWPRQELLSIGPAWARGWELTFFVALLVGSLAIKFGLRIH